MPPLLGAPVTLSAAAEQRRRHQAGTEGVVDRIRRSCTCGAAGVRWRRGSSAGKPGIMHPRHASFQGERARPAAVCSAGPPLPSRTKESLSQWRLTGSPGTELAGQAAKAMAFAMTQAARLPPRANLSKRIGCAPRAARDGSLLRQAQPACGGAAPHWPARRSASIERRVACTGRAWAGEVLERAPAPAEIATSMSRDSTAARRQHTAAGGVASPRFIVSFGVLFHPAD